MSKLTICQFASDDVLTFHEGIVRAYADVFAEPPWNEDADNFEAFAESLLLYARSSGFRGAIAIDPSGEIHGFALGANWIHDNWWCSRVEEDLGPRAAGWTTHCFHLMELAVESPYRGCGYGAKLYEALVSDLPHRTAILSTNRLGPVAAATLYARRGWRILLEEWRHCANCEPVQVLGLNEPGALQVLNR